MIASEQLPLAPENANRPANGGVFPLGRDIAEGVLHNMSTPPKSVVKFEGLGELVVEGQPGGSGVAGTGGAGNRIFGVAVRFELPPDWRDLPVRDVLRRLDPDCKARTTKLREKRIAKLIEQRAAELPLPDGCLVIVARDEHTALWDDPLSALSVLSKCTDTVWLRGKSPSLAAAQERGVVALLVPPTFAAQLPAPPDQPARANTGRNS